MKTVVEETKKEVIETTTYYEAADGTKFTDQKECELYEKTAAAVLMARTEEFTIADERKAEQDWFDEEDNTYKTVVPTTKEHIDILNQLWFMFSHKEEPKFTDADIKKVFCIGYMYNQRGSTPYIDYMWFKDIEDFIADVTGGKYILVAKPEK